jgi:hypothetical protein
LVQISGDFFDYWKDIWNYFDFIPPIFIITMVFMDQYQIRMNLNETPTQIAIQAIATLMIWLKFLYFLRIFEATSSLIRMIMQVIYDIRYFLMVLLLTIIAFGDSFKTISNGNDKAGRFVDKGFFGSFFFVYNMSLGDFDTGKFGDIQVGLVWFLFFFCTMFNMIIMLNLLISIISESYTKISENIKAAAYQEKASMVAGNTFMIPDKRRNEFCLPNKYLVVAKDVSGEIDADEDEMEEHFENLRKQVMTKVDASQKHIEKHVSQMGDNFNKRMDLLCGEEEQGALNTTNAAPSQSFIGGSPLGRNRSMVDDEMELTGDVEGQMKSLFKMFKGVI